MSQRDTTYSDTAHEMSGKIAGKRFFEIFFSKRAKKFSEMLRAKFCAASGRASRRKFLTGASARETPVTRSRREIGGDGRRRYRRENPNAGEKEKNRKFWREEKKIRFRCRACKPPWTPIRPPAQPSTTRATIPVTPGAKDASTLSLSLFLSH